MPTDQHQTRPLTGPLADRKLTDMPAARAMIVVIVALLVISTIVFSVIEYRSNRQAPEAVPGTEMGYPAN